MSNQGGPIVYTADPGETNDVTVSETGSSLEVTDNGTSSGGAVVVIVGGTCGNNAVNSADCPVSGHPSVEVDLGDGNDAVTVDPSIDGVISSLTFNGGAGNDTITNDSTVPATASYADAASGVTVDLGAESAPNDGDGGSDQLSGIQNVVGSANNDAIAGDAAANDIAGGPGSDEIAGAGGDDVLAGGSGTDDVTYSSLPGTSYTGSPTDSVNVSLAAGTATGEGADSLSGFEQVTGSPFNDQLTPAGSGSTLAGGQGNDTLLNGPGNDTLIGGAGHDTLFGGTGSDTFDGGTGLNTLDFSNAIDSVAVNLSTGVASSAGDSDTISPNSFRQVIGSSYADVLRGDNNNNLLRGGDGNDVLDGRLGDDVLDGGGGRNTADYSSPGGPAVTASLAAGTALGAGSDTLENIQNLTGSDNSDQLIGDAENNVLQGGLGNDVINGRGGDDIMDGGGGTDTVSFAGSSTGVVADLGAGEASGAGADSMTGFENVTGSSFADEITGDSGPNTLNGAAGNDSINSRDGTADTVQCGTGTDSAVIDPADTVTACENVDNGAPANTSPPKITGTPKVGKTLTCSLGTWTGTPPITYTRQWRRNGVAIAGATGAQYVAKSADAGHSLTCTVTAHNAAGTASSTSAAVHVTQ